MAGLCYVIGDSLILIPVAFVGIRTYFVTDSILLGIIAGIVAGPVFTFFAWLGSRAKRRLRIQAFLENDPEGIRLRRDAQDTLMSYGRLDGPLSQRDETHLLLQRVADEIERYPGFILDKMRASWTLHDLAAEGFGGGAAIAVLYSLASNTTSWDTRLMSNEDDQIAASVFLPGLDDFLKGRGHNLNERALIEVLMMNYYEVLRGLGERTTSSVLADGRSR